MNRQTGKRAAGVAADLFVFLAGGIAAVHMGVFGRINDFYLYSADVLTIFSLCMFSLIFIVEVVSVFKISDSTWHTAFLAACLLGYHLTSVDFLHLTNMETGVLPPVADSLNFFFFILAVLAVLGFWTFTYKPRFPRTAPTVFSAAALLCFAAYFPLESVGLGILSFSVFALLAAAAAFYTASRLFAEGSADLTFFISSALFASVLGSRFTVSLCKACGFAPNGFPSFYALPIIAGFLAVYIAFAMRTDRAALRANEYKLQYERIKARALHEQIKPHFVFNVLAAIQSLYRIGLDEGDRATALFSMHLRTNIEASDTDLIPFEKELDNIEVYIDLENMRLGKQINVIFDIEDTDFEVPVLSLQPYIENAIKYSRVNEKEEGYIRITSRRTEEGVLLEVADNGVGFDPASVPPSSCGIRNSSERFSMLMGIKPEIASEVGKGTVVRIFIPDAQEGAQTDGAARRIP